MHADCLKQIEMTRMQIKNQQENEEEKVEKYNILGKRKEQENGE